MSAEEAEAVEGAQVVVRSGIDVFVAAAVLVMTLSAEQRSRLGSFEVMYSVGSVASR